MGALLIAIVLFAPRGLAPLAGLLVQRTARLVWRRS
jgi:hypothetical protein